MERPATTCEEYSGNLLAGIRDELPEEDAGRLTDHLDGCESCGAEQAEILALADLMAKVPDFEPYPETFAAIESRMNEEAPTTRTSRRSLWFFGAALAAAAALLVFLLLPPSSPTVTTLAGSIRISVNTLESVTMSRFRVESGRPLDVVAAAGTRLVFEAPGELEVETGRVQVTVGEGDKPIRFRTPHGSVEITGTVFDIRVGATATDVSVLEGAVTVRADGGDPVRVATGMTVKLGAGGTPSPAPVDPWRIREWCHAPTALLDASPDRLLLTLRNDSVLPIAVEPFDPGTATWSLRVTWPDGRTSELRLQEGTVLRGAREATDPRYRTLRPGDAYVLEVDRTALPLPPGTYGVSAVYKPYGEPPADAWHGIRVTKPLKLTVE